MDPREEKLSCVHGLLSVAQPDSLEFFSFYLSWSETGKEHPTTDQTVVFNSSFKHGNFFDHSALAKKCQTFHVFCRIQKWCPFRFNACLWAQKHTSNKNKRQKAKRNITRWIWLHWNRFQFRVEAKNQERFSMLKKYRQSQFCAQEAVMSVSVWWG